MRTERRSGPLPGSHLSVSTSIQHTVFFSFGRYLCTLCEKILTLLRRAGR